MVEADLLVSRINEAAGAFERMIGLIADITGPDNESIKRQMMQEVSVIHSHHCDHVAQSVEPIVNANLRLSSAVR